jgi:hypothetical protein
MLILGSTVDPRISGLVAPQALLLCHILGIDSVEYGYAEEALLPSRSMGATSSPGTG